MDNIILFDGLCNFCDHSVQFIIKRDHAELYKFASLQSDIGQKLLKQYDIPHDTDSFVLLTQGSWYSKSTAALHVAHHLNGLTKMLYPLLLIPRPIRDLFYNIFAKNRYQWFGKKDHCTLPSPEVRNRFLS